MEGSRGSTSRWHCLTTLNTTLNRTHAPWETYLFSWSHVSMSRILKNVLFTTFSFKSFRSNFAKSQSRFTYSINDQYWQNFTICTYHVAKKSATTSLVPAFISSGLNWVSSVSTLTLVMTMTLKILNHKMVFNQATWPALASKICLQGSALYPEELKSARYPNKETNQTE